MSPRPDAAAPLWLSIARGRWAGIRLRVTAIGVVYVTGRLIDAQGEMRLVMVPRCHFDGSIGPSDDERAQRRRLAPRAETTGEYLSVVLR